MGDRGAAAGCTRGMMGLLLLRRTKPRGSPSEPIRFDLLKRRWLARMGPSNRLRSIPPLSKHAPPINRAVCGEESNSCPSLHAEGCGAVSASLSMERFGKPGVPERRLSPKRVLAIGWLGSLRVDGAATSHLIQTAVALSSASHQ